MDGVCFIDETGLVFEGDEAVGEADGDVDDVAVRCGKLERGGMAVSGRLFPQIEKNVDDFSSDAVDQFLMGVRGYLEMHPTNHSCGGS